MQQFRGLTEFLDIFASVSAAQTSRIAREFPLRFL